MLLYSNLALHKPLTIRGIPIAAETFDSTFDIFFVCHSYGCLWRVVYFPSNTGNKRKQKSWILHLKITIFPLFKRHAQAALQLWQTAERQPHHQRWALSSKMWAALHSTVACYFFHLWLQRSIPTEAHCNPKLKNLYNQNPYSFKSFSWLKAE